MKEIENLHSQFDIEGLCSLVPAALANPSEEYRQELVTAIWDILNQWMYDFSCSKGGDPADYPFENGLQALEDLGQIDIPVERVSYFLTCGDYAQEHASAAQAAAYFEKAILLAQNILAEDSCEHRAYASLIYAYRSFPTQDFAVAESYFAKALDLAEKTELVSDDFYITNLYLLYQNQNFASFKSRIEALRRNFAAESLARSRKSPLFALRMASEFSHFLMNQNADVSPEIKNEIFPVIEAASACVNLDQEYDRTMAGHVFSKEGARFEREDFLNVAETLFKRALMEKSPLSLLNVYLAQTWENQAILKEKKGDHASAEKIRDRIRMFYLDQAPANANVSYLSHATEYLLNDVLSKPREKVSSDLLEELSKMALTAEKIGEGHYWYPYHVLFTLELYQGKVESAKLWLARGYRVLNLFVGDELKKLFEFTKKSGNIEASHFVGKLIDHFDHKLEKKVWNGGPPLDELAKMSLQDFEAWLVASAVQEEN